MGGLTSNESTYSYLYTNTDYWTMSRGHNSIGNLISDVQSNGRVLNITNTSTIEVRPVVSLNSEVSLTSGSGTPEDPYTVS